MIEQESFDSGCSHDLGAVARKNIAVNAPVITNHHGWLLKVLEQIGGKPSRRLGNQHAVHAVRTSSKFAAQASRAKAKAFAHSVSQSLFIASGNKRF